MSRFACVIAIISGSCLPIAVCHDHGENQRRCYGSHDLSIDDGGEGTD